MATITYESDLSVLSLGSTDVLDCIEEFGVDEDVTLLAWLKTETGDGKDDLRVEVNSKRLAEIFIERQLISNLHSKFEFINLFGESKNKRRVGL